MYGQNEQDHEWVAEEWAGEDPTQDRDPTPRWTLDQWVGDQGHGSSRHLSVAEMPEGERGLSGFRHNPSGSHWAPAH